MYDVCVITTIHQPNDARIADRGIRIYAEAGLKTCVISTWPYVDIGVPFNNWIADIGQVGNVAPVNKAISAGALRATLDDVSGQCGLRQLVKIIGRPTELM